MSGVKLWGLEGANPQEKEGPICPGIRVVRGEGGTPVLYRPHVAMIELVLPPKGDNNLWGLEGAYPHRLKSIKMI